MIDRTKVIKGPAYVIFDSVEIFSQGDITVDLGLDTFNVNTSTHGKVDERVRNRAISIQFTPVGEWEALSQLFPYGSTAHGASIFSGKSLVIKPIAAGSNDITFHDAAVTAIPELRFSAVQTLIGPVTFTAINVNATEWSNAAALMTLAASAAWDSTAQALVSIPGILTQAYTFAWGATAPWKDIKTVDGVRATFDLSLNPLESDADGIYDMQFSELAVNIMARVLAGTTTTAGDTAIDESDLIAALRMQGTGVARGGSLQSMVAAQSDITLSGTGVGARFSGCALKSAQMIYAPNNTRYGECQWIATREVGSSGLKPLFALGSSVPTEG